MNAISPFHLAIPVHDLQEARTFYRDILKCQEGRSSDLWVDFNFYGHQLVIHHKAKAIGENDAASNEVDGHDVPIPHFGVVLPWEDWHQLADRLKAHQIQFIIEPYIRFKGEVGEQATMFFMDPCDNAIEFKAFQNIDQLFAK